MIAGVDRVAEPARDVLRSTGRRSSSGTSWSPGSPASGMPSRISLSVSYSAARSANRLFCGGTGRSQISKCCCAARDVGQRERRPAVLDEVLDVRVVAVVQAALAAQVVHQHAVERAVLAQVRARDGQRVEVGVLARVIGSGRPIEIALARASFSTIRIWFAAAWAAGGSCGSGARLGGSAANRLANASAKPSG